MENNKIVPTCLICHQVPQDGFRAGIFIRKKFICNACEKQLIENALQDGSNIEKMRPLGKIICREAWQ